MDLTTMLQKVSIILLMALSLLNCTSLQTVDTDTAKYDIEVGDLVLITKLNLKRYQFTVESVTPRYVSGEGFKIEFADIASVEKQQFSLSTSVLNILTFGVLAGLAVAESEIESHVDKQRQFPTD